MFRKLWHAAMRRICRSRQRPRSGRTGHVEMFSGLQCARALPSEMQLVSCKVRASPRTKLPWPREWDPGSAASRGRLRSKNWNVKDAGQHAHRRRRLSKTDTNQNKGWWTILICLQLCAGRKLKDVRWIFFFYSGLQFPRQATEAL